MPLAVLRPEHVYAYPTIITCSAARARVHACRNWFHALCTGSNCDSTSIPLRYGDSTICNEIRRSFCRRVSSSSLMRELIWNFCPSVRPSVILLYCIETVSCAYHETFSHLVDILFLVLSPTIVTKYLGKPSTGASVGRKICTSPLIYVYLFICSQNNSHSRHELDKKANKLALTVAHKHNRPLQIIQMTVTNHKNHTISCTSINQSINQSLILN